MASLGIGYRFRVKTVATTPARGTAEALPPRVLVAHVSKTSLKPLFVSVDTIESRAKNCRSAFTIQEPTVHGADDEDTR